MGCIKKLQKQIKKRWWIIGLKNSKKRLTHNLTEKLFKSAKKDTADKSRSSTFAKDQDNPNLRKILREENRKNESKAKERNAKEASDS